MLTIKKISIDNLDELIFYECIESILNKETGNREYFGIIDDKTILGHGSITVFSHISLVQIHEIYILPQERNSKLGDSLLRALLNYGRINLCEWAIVEEKEQTLGGFLIKKGINKIDYNELPLQAKDIFEKDPDNNYYICNIEEFFSRKCGGCKI